MKMKFLCINIFLILYAGLYARENPFEPTSIYKMEVDRLLQMNKDSSSDFEEDEQNVHIVQKIEEEKNITIDNKDIQQEEVSAKKSIEEEKSIDILPFMNIKYTSNKMQITSKYRVIRQFTLEKENKIVLDYDGKIPFLTKNRVINRDYFEEIIVGSHYKENYFRVVIVVKDIKSEYKINYNKLVSINFNKKSVQ